MKPLIDKELLKILACPLCKSDLKLFDYRKKKGKDVDGELVCQNKDCGQKYPIKDGIPVLLPPDLRD